MKIFEIVVGFVVLLLVLHVTTIFYSKSSFSYSKDHYALHAIFSTVNGLKSGSKVGINGVKIGYVKSIEIQKDYTVKVVLLINNNFMLPTDTAASLLTEGLIGDKYIQLIPGASTEYLREDDVIEYTNSYDFTMESIINKFIMNNAKN